MSKAKTPLRAGGGSCYGRLGFCYRQRLSLSVRTHIAGRLVSRFLNVDATLEEGAIFDADALRNHVAGKRALTADIHAVAGAQVTFHFADHHDFARSHVRRNHTV